MDTAAASSPGARPFSWRAFVSFVVLFAFAVLAVTGIALYATPPGRVANWSGWTLLGLTKTNWQAVHMVFGFLFVVAGAFHLFFNWKVLLNYLRSRVHAGIPRRRELAWSALAGTVLVAMSIADLPPVSAISRVREQLANSWSSSGTEPPIPHAELLTVEGVATLLKIPVDDAVGRLQSAGFAAAPHATLEHLAAQRGVTPQEVYRLLGAAAAPTASLPASGMGWKTVRQISDELHVPVETSIARLRSAGLDAGPDEALRDIARRHGRHAPELASLLVQQ
jgi:hypothetical protein